MRMLIQASCPPEPFNTLVRKGTAGEIMAKILKAIKPEAAYFTDMHGQRTAILIVNMDSPGKFHRWRNLSF